MSNKKPAHEVIVEMIGEVTIILSKNKYTADHLKVAARLGALAAEIEILKRMIIPEKYREDVVNALRQIKTNCLNIGGVLTDELFLDIASPEKTNKV